MIITILLIAVAAICNSIMDTVQFRFKDSVFKNITWFNPESSLGLRWFWGKEIKQINDAWHFFKMIMIGCIIAAVSLNQSIVTSWICFLILSVIWNLFFNLFYDKFWRSNGS